MVTTGSVEQTVEAEHEVYPTPDVVVVNSPLFREPDLGYDEDSLPPIGLGLVATALVNAGLSVHVMDPVANHVSLQDLKRAIRRMGPSVVAINIFTTNYELVQELVESMAGWAPHVVVGGLATAALYPGIFGWDYPAQLDVVSGDGENLVVPLVLGRAAEAPAAATHNRRFFRVDRDSKYYSADVSNVPLDRRLLPSEPILRPSGLTEAHMTAGRGCIHNCAFCAAARSLNRNVDVRERSIGSLRAELETIQATLPDVRSIRVLDDLFLKDASSLAKAEAVFRSFDFVWRAMAHVSTFGHSSVDDLVRLRESGCSELFVGIESGSERVLRAIRKTADRDVIKARLELVLGAGIPLKGYFMYGFPGETKEDFESTLGLASDLREAALERGMVFRTSVFQFRPYHGTDLFRIVQGTHDSQIRIAADDALSARIGRSQFNFQAGNYSAESDECLREYICRTMQLNDAQ